MDNKTKPSSAFIELIVFSAVFVLALVLSYYFNVFLFIVEYFQKNPASITYIDEIIVGLVVLSVSSAIFAWRRLMELKKETEKCILAEKEVAQIAHTQAETEKIISKQLHSEIELLLKYLKEDREILLSKIRNEKPRTP